MVSVNSSARSENVMTIFATVLGALHGAVERHKMNELEGRLDQRASQIKPFVEWRKSVVDLLKLLGVDSSYEHRIMLAQKFGNYIFKYLIFGMMVMMVGVSTAAEPSDHTSNSQPRFFLFSSNFSPSQYTPNQTPAVAATYRATANHFAISIWSIVRNVILGLAACANVAALIIYLNGRRRKRHG